MLDMQTVSITKFEHAGKFCCQPVRNDKSDCYLEYLASLNTYFDNNNDSDSMYMPRVGQLYAAYTSVGDSDQKFWYRGQVICIFQSTSGFIARLFLVDEGHIVCVTKARLKVMHPKFENFPHQFLQCFLYGIAPVTLSPNFQLQMSIQKTLYWDNSATEFVEQTINGKNTAIKVVSENSDCSKNVVLYVQKEGLWCSVNEMLVKGNFGYILSNDDVSQVDTLKPTENVFKSNTQDQIPFSFMLNDESPIKSKINFMLNDESPIKSKTNFMLNDESPIKSKINFEQNLPVLHEVNEPKLSTIETINSYNLLQKQRDQQQKLCRNHVSKDCEDLLNLLNKDQTNVTPESIFTKDSDISNMESMNMSKIQSFKSRLVSPSKLLENNLGKESSDILSKSFNLQNEQLCSINSGSPNKQIQADTINDQFSTPTPFKPFAFLNSKESSEEDSNLVDASPVLQALSVGGMNGSTKNNDDIFVHGKLKREPFERLSSLELPLPLKKKVIELGFESPTQFQSHIFPAVMAFRHIVGIPELNSNNISKIVGYILPILKNLVEKNDIYKNLGNGNGPFVLVCVSDWIEAQQVYDVCQNLASYKTTVRIDIFYGGMDNEEERNVRLINGCEILIVTMPALIKILFGGFTNLKRLCHVIFDNADVLVEKYTEDIKIFMRLFAQTLMELKRSESTQHIIVMSKKWSNGIRSLINSYLVDPLVIIGNKIEAALFAEVPMVVQLCNSVERLDYLLGFLETDAQEKNTIIFTNSAKSAEELQDQLTRYSIFSNVITEFMSPLAVKDVKLSWNTSLKRKSNFLIMSDKSVLSSGIKNASYIVHYDFCQKKSEFGNRLNCLQEIMRENEDSFSKKELYSLIFVTELDNGMRYSTGLVKLLRRSGQEISEELQTMALSSQEIKESQKEFYEICPHLKLFGYCNYIEDCNERHTIFPQRDLIGLCPSAGYVKVIILAIINASSYWGRIIEHNLPFKQENSSYETIQYVRLALDIQLYYANKSFHQPCVSVERFDVCVVKTDCGYERVRVEKVLEREFERPKLLQVFGIDSGITIKVMFKELLICPQFFKEVPAQAVEIIVSCVKPVDSSSFWTHEASQTMERRILGKTLEGRVQFSLQNTIWVDPLLEKDVLSGVQTKTYILDVGRELIYLGYGEKNSKHILNLRNLLYDVQGRPMDTNSQLKMLPHCMTDHDFEYLHDDDYEDVYISAVVHPGLFYVQRMESIALIEKLDDKIQATMEVTKTDQSNTNQIFPIGSICAAQFSLDKKWYRGKVCEISKNEYNIFFVDHGDREWLTKEKVIPAWDDLLIQPFQAIECACTSVLPNGNKWEDYEGDIMWEITSNRLLSVKVVSTQASTNISNMVRYEVELFDVTSNPTININHELVIAGAAKASLQCLKEIFPHATLSNAAELKSITERCADMCVQTYEEQDLKKKLSKCHQIKDIVLASNNNELVERGCVYSICKLFSLTKDDALLKILLECLQHFIHLSKENCSIFFDEGTLKAMCILLKKNGNESLQKLILNIILYFCDEERFLLHLSDNGFVTSCCKILKQTNDSEIIISILKGIHLSLNKNGIFAGVIRHEGALDTILHFLEKNNNESIILASLETLQSSLLGFRNQEYFREIGGLKTLLSLIKRKPNEMMIKSVLEIFQVFITDNEKNRDYLHKVAVHEQLKIYAFLPMRFSVNTKKLMNSLIAQLSPVPKSHKILKEKENLVNGKLVENLKKEHSVVKSSVSPKVLWSQRSNTVTLSIQLRDVQSEETSFTSTSMKFRTVVNGVEYILSLQLYREIIPEKCHVSRKSSEVLVVLHKVLNEIWLRLPKSPKKVTNIGIDYDRWSDSDVDECEDTFETWYSNGCLPPAPICTAYQPGDRLFVAPLDASDSSSDEFSSDLESEDLCDKDYFNV